MGNALRARLSRPGHQLLLLLVVPVLVLSLTGCDTKARALVLAFGDSNFPTAPLQADAALNHAAFGSTYGVANLALPGYGLRNQPANDTGKDLWQENIDSWCTLIKPGLIYVQLGVNDAVRDYSNYDQAIDAFVGFIDQDVHWDDVPILWSNLPLTPGSETGEIAVNTALDAAAIQHGSRAGGFQVINIRDAFAGHPEYFVNFASGDVHYSAAGYQKLADIVTAALDATTPAASTTPTCSSPIVTPTTTTTTAPPGPTGRAGS